MRSLNPGTRLWKSAVIAILLGGTILALPTDSNAQLRSWDSRGFVTINGGYQVASTDFTDNVVFTLNVEEGDFDAGYRVDTGLVLDVSGGVRVWHNLAIGVGVSRFSRDDHAADVTARIPHPFFFDQHRLISGSAVGLRRQEIAVHVQALWIVPVSDRFDLALFGGPTFVDVTQDLLTEVEFTESFPFDTATFTGAATREQSKSGVGFNVGVDFTYFLQPAGSGARVGLGTLVRFSRASIDFASEDGDTITVDAGGVRIAGGLRLRF